MGFNLRDYQSEALAAVEASWEEGINRPVVILPTGCHRAGQGVLMWDGDIKAVEDVAVGDLLMGPDSRPRTVLALARGTGRMMRVVPVKGSPWVVNDEHVLSLVQTNTDSRGTYPSEMRGGTVTDVEVRDYEKWSEWRKHTHKLFRAGVDFPATDTPQLDPYFLGLVLGDGSLSQNYRISVATIDPEITQYVLDTAESYGLSVRRDGRNLIQHHLTSGTEVRAGRRGGTNPVITELRRLGLLPIACQDRFIPDTYRLGSRTVRLETLAGLLDSDGYLANGGFEFASKSRRLADGVAFIARSLGLAAYIAIRFGGPAAGQFRVTISGDCNMIPTRVARKRAAPRIQKKDVLRTGFTVEPTGTVEPFYGFTLDGDHRYLLDDFTVTHNSGKTVCFSGLIQNKLPELSVRGERVLVLAHREELLEQAEKKIKDMIPDVWTSIVKGSRGKNTHQFADVIVASVQTLARRPALPKIGMVIVDECHRYASPTYKDVLERYGCMDKTPTIGFTATLTRMDGGLPEVWQSVAYQKKIHWMIKNGYLVPPVARSIEVPGLNLASTRVTRGDINAKDLSNALEDSAAFSTIAESWVEVAADRPTIVFMPDVRTANHMAEAYGAVGVKAEVVTGDTKTEARRAIYARFEDGTTRVLVNCMVLTEGFDAPQTSCVVIGRPTINPGLYIQMVGRGLRLADGKDDCLVLDIAGASLKHNLAGVNDLESDCESKCDCGCLVCGCSDRCKCGIRQCGCRCIEQHEAPSNICSCAASDECGCGCPGDMDGTGLDACVCSLNPECPCRGEGEIPEAKEVSADVLKKLVDVDILGTELSASKFTWLKTDGGISFLQTGSDTALFLLPSTPGAVTYYLGRVTNAGSRKPGVDRLDDGAVDAVSARVGLEQIASDTGYQYNNRKASWRRTPASEAQLGLLSRFGVAGYRLEGLKKGQASDMLSVVKFSRALDPRFAKYVAPKMVNDMLEP